jgi:hypothetical protein
MDKHKYIELIEYALENPRFSVIQACEATGLSDGEFRFIRREIFVLNMEQDSAELHTREVQEWKLHPQAYFNYLQFCEFKHSLEESARAQENAQRAHWIAIAAIVISVVVGLSPIVAKLWSYT